MERKEKETGETKLIIYAKDYAETGREIRACSHCWFEVDNDAKECWQCGGKFIKGGIKGV